MLQIDNLTVAYGSKKVLDRLTLQLPAGEVHGIVGLNGSGKTTLLNTLYGFIKPLQGNVQFNGVALQRNDIGFLQAENFFYSGITGEEYLALFHHHNPSFDIIQWNSLFELPLQSLIETYSTGMRKKLAFLGVICLDTPIFVFDEPYNGLDLETNRKLKMIIQALKKSGKTILLTSHVLETLTSVCNTISFLSNQTILQTFHQGEFTLIEAHLFGLNDEIVNQQIAALLQKKE